MTDVRRDAGGAVVVDRGRYAPRAVLDDLGNCVSALMLHRRSGPDSSVPIELLDEVWRSVLAGLVQRHHLAPDPFGATQARWRSAECQQAWAWAFLQEEVLRHPGAGVATPIDSALLMHRAKKWVWRQHRKQDPLGADVFQALGGAVRALLAAGCPVIGLRGGSARTGHWLRDAILPAATLAAGDRLSLADLEALVDCGGWHRGVARAGKRGLRTWLETWLRSLPSLWPRANWPGCTVKEILGVLVARVRAEATRTVSVEHDDGSLLVTDTRRGAPATIGTGSAAVAVKAWLALRLLTPQHSLRVPSMRSLYGAVRSDILGRTNRPRHKRCTRLALWMLRTARDRFADDVAKFSSSLTDVERSLAVVRAAADQLLAILQDWPTESDLSQDFYQPRIQRRLFRPVQRVQQTEDRDVVRQALLHYLGNELR